MMSCPSARTTPTDRIDRAADDADQRRLAGTVRTQECEDLAAADLQIDVLQRLEAGPVGLAKARYGDDGIHGAPFAAPLYQLNSGGVDRQDAGAAIGRKPQCRLGSWMRGLGLGEQRPGMVAGRIVLGRGRAELGSGIDLSDIGCWSHEPMAASALRTSSSTPTATVPTRRPTLS